MLCSTPVTRMRVRVRIVAVAPGARVPSEHRSGRRCVQVPRVVVSDSTCAALFASFGWNCGISRRTTPSASWSPRFWTRVTVSTVPPTRSRRRHDPVRDREVRARGPADDARSGRRIGGARRQRRIDGPDRRNRRRDPGCAAGPVNERHGHELVLTVEDHDRVQADRGRDGAVRIIDRDRVRGAADDLVDRRGTGHVAAGNDCGTRLARGEREHLRDAAVIAVGDADSQVWPAGASPSVRSSTVICPLQRWSVPCACTVVVPEVARITLLPSPPRTTKK